MKVATMLGTAIAGIFLVGAILVDPVNAAPPYRAPVTAQLVLSYDRGPAGPPIEGTLTFTNVTTHTVSVNQCRGWFQVGLQSRTVPFNPSWGPPVGCESSAYHLPPGYTRFHVVLSTRYYACDAFYTQQAIPPGTAPCTKTGNSPPLPPGRYLAEVVTHGVTVKVIRPLAVALVAARNS